MKSKLIELKKIKPNRIRYEVLPDGFIERVQKYKEILKEVETSSLEETVSNFQRDLYPEDELLIWECIASCYKLRCENNPHWKIEDRQKTYVELITASMR